MFASAKIADVAEQVVDAKEPQQVIDEQGRPVGAVDGPAIIRVLIGKED